MKNKSIKAVEAKTLGRGRPTLYKGEFAQVAYELALLGLSNSEMAEAMGVSLTTFKTWLKQHSEFSTTVLKGKEIADSKVAAGLYKRATGYEYESEKIFMTKEAEVVRVKITVHVPPDPGAAMNWLKNRQPYLWSDKQRSELSGTMTVTMDLGGDAGDKGEMADFEEVEESENDE